MDGRTLGKDTLRDQHRLNALGHYADYLCALPGTLTALKNIITHCSEQSHTKSMVRQGM